MTETVSDGQGPLDVKNARNLFSVLFIIVLNRRYSMSIKYISINKIVLLNCIQSRM